jgi:hypothetical protein
MALQDELLGATSGATKGEYTVNFYPLEVGADADADAAAKKKELNLPEEQKVLVVGSEYVFHHESKQYEVGGSNFTKTLAETLVDLGVAKTLVDGDRYLMVLVKNASTSSEES